MCYTCLRSKDVDLGYASTHYLNPPLENAPSKEKSVVLLCVVAYLLCVLLQVSQEHHFITLYVYKKLDNVVNVGCDVEKSRFFCKTASTNVIQIRYNEFFPLPLKYHTPIIVH